MVSGFRHRTDFPSVLFKDGREVRLTFGKCASDSGTDPTDMVQNSLLPTEDHPRRAVAIGQDQTLPIG